MSMSRSTASESSGSHLDGQASDAVRSGRDHSRGRSLFRADDLRAAAESLPRLPVPSERRGMAEARSMRKHNFAARKHNYAAAT